MSWRDYGEYEYIPPSKLLVLARSKFLSAKALLEHEGYEFERAIYDSNENAVYLAGYALELVLKRHIALTLGWVTFPPKKIKTGIKGYKDEHLNTSFHIHDLNRLLVLSGLHGEVIRDEDLNSYWIKALNWQAEVRYCAPGLISNSEAMETVESILYMIRWIVNKT